MACQVTQADRRFLLRMLAHGVSECAQGMMRKPPTVTRYVDEAGTNPGMSVLQNARERDVRSSFIAWNEWG